MEKSEWDSYVGMNQGYNAIFDNWQNISELLSPEANNAINYAMNILDSALTEVKATVKPAVRSSEDKKVSAPKFKLEL